MIRLLFLLLAMFVNPIMALATDSIEFKSVQEILDLYHKTNQTPCASKVFADALNNADKISEDTPENIARIWAKNVMLAPDVLIKVLECPELKDISPTTTIVFSPVVYKFPNGRTLTINYTTQPKTLQHHIELANKRSLPNSNPNPELNNPTDPSKYMNTEPAWYAIMVVQHDSLSEFVGPGKNNTLSVKYLYDNIDNIYPHGYSCTSKSALANDNDTINKAVRNTIALDEDDSNDYYVAGDVNLEWVMYAEIAADILLTVATMGGGEVLTMASKAKNATRIADNLNDSMKVLSKIDEVKDYIELSKQITTHTDDIVKIKNATTKAAPLWDDYIKLIKNVEKEEANIAKLYKEVNQINDAISSGTKTKKDLLKILDLIESKEATIKNTMGNADKLMNQIGEAFQTVKYLDSETFHAGKTIIDATKSEAEIAKIEKEIKAATEAAENLAKADKNVALFKESAEALQKVSKYKEGLLALRRPQTGNIITRTLKSLYHAETGADKLAKASKLARTGMSSKSAKLLDWLFENGLKFGSRLGKYHRNAGLLYQSVKFLGDMYDQTSTTSKEFSNGIEFKPLCLLSADDLKGQENVVNYGMWLMWIGNSTDPADDDAAYLQAMDFATKFAYNLNKVQSEDTVNCNVDIYVVRPIIKLDETNLEDPKGEMFYLFMNEIPWTTHDQFTETIKDVTKWEAEQQQRFNQNPIKKRGYKLQSEIEQSKEQTNPDNIEEITTEQKSDDISDENVSDIPDKSAEQ